MADINGTPSMVAHPELDFPDSLTDFHCGAVFAWREAINEFEDRCRDLPKPDAIQLRDAVDWLDEKIQRYQAAAERAAHVHNDDCMCVLEPTEVEGPVECFYCGGHTAGPCGDRCDIARAEVVDDRASVLPDPGLDVYDVAGPEPSADVLVLHDPAGADINGGYLHRCAESGWSWSDNADTTPLPYITEGLEWGVPGGSVRERAQGPLVVVRRSAPGDKENTRG